MVSDFSVIWISISVIVLCWAVVRINQKIDETIRNYRPNSILDGTSRPGSTPGEHPDAAGSG
jgi:hypothetical protein